MNEEMIKQQGEMHARLECVKVVAVGMEGHPASNIVAAAEVLWAFVKGDAK